MTPSSRTLDPRIAAIVANPPLLTAEQSITIAALGRSIANADADDSHRHAQQSQEAA